MRKILVLLLFSVCAFAQTRNVNYGNWISSKDSISVQLMGNDIDTVLFSFRSLRTNPDPATNTLNPPDDVYWSGDANILIYPAIAGDGDLETDSLEIYYFPIDENGSILYGPKSWCDFSQSTAEWAISQTILNWSANTIYGCSITGSLPPCNGIAVFIRQYASADTTNLSIKLVKD